MLVPEPAGLLAGEVVAHAAWSISEAPEGEILIPLAGILHEGKVELIRFTSEDLPGELFESLLALARERLGNQQDLAEAWTLTYPCASRPGESRCHCVRGLGAGHDHPGNVCPTLSTLSLRQLQASR